MTNRYAHLLIGALVAASSVRGAAENSSVRPAQATVRGEIRNPTLREFTFDYMSPQALEKTRKQVVLDSGNRFTLTLPVTRGTLVTGHYHNGQPRSRWKEWLEPLFGDTGHLVLFVEPGDSLEVVMEVGWFSTTFQFRGRNADNNRFLAGRISGFLPLRLDYQSLEVEDFTRGMDKWRREQLELLAEGKEEYALSQEFIDYAEAFFQYEWAERMITYPAVYRRVNREDNREITAEYFAFLKKVPLVDEKAIGVENYRPFLVHALDRVLEEAPPPSRLSDQYDFSRSGLSDAAEARLDSLYENRTPPAFSQQFDLRRFGLSEADGARLDSFFDRHNRSYIPEISREITTPGIDTTGEALVIELPGNERLESFRRRGRLSEEIDLSSLGLPAEARVRLDSIYADTDPRWGRRIPKRYDLAGKRLEGRVLYWFRARELIDGLKTGGEPSRWALGKWEEFRRANPFPEYFDAVRKAMDKTLKLQPGKPAPDFTLRGLDGEPVSLSRFKGKVVLLDFWAGWCAPCIRDLVFLRRIEEKTDPGSVVFLKVSLEEEAAWRRAIDEHGIGGVHVHAGGWSADVAISYNVNHIPSYYLIDSKGMIVERLRGVRDVEDVAAEIEKSL